MALGAAGPASATVRDARPAAVADVPADVLAQALRARACAGEVGERPPPEGRDVLSIIDFSRPSTEPRMWVVDLDEGKVLFRLRVAHGRASGEDRATWFSNELGSNASSLGLFRTAEVYQGRHGRSLRLDGLEPGTNDRARERGIVVHSAPYCTPEHVARWGRLGRSQGCPALDPEVTDAVIDTIRDGTLLFAWYPDPEWQARSPLLSCTPS